MSKPSPSKRKRQLRNKKQRQKNTQARNQRKQSIAKFPKVVYENADAPPALVEAVKTTLDEIVLNHERIMPKPLAELFHRVRVEGMRPVVLDLQTASYAAGLRHAGQQNGYLEYLFLLTLGTRVFERLPNHIRKEYFPFNDVEVTLGAPRPNQIRVRFRALKRKKTIGGTAYYSPYEPKIEVDGESKLVAFSTHAVERICERAVHDWQSYGGAGDAFAFLHDCLYFEPCRLARDEPGFAIFEHARPPFFSWNFVTSLLNEIDQRKTYYYRVGYCPIFVTDQLAVAKTMLLPGMDGTPEYSEVLRHRIRSPSDRKALREAVEHTTLRDLVLSRDFTLMKQMHDGGVEQVMLLDGHKVFVDL